MTQREVETPTPGPAPLAKYNHERVLKVFHWTDRLFTVQTTRNAGFRFANGQFVMMGLELEARAPLVRAYSMASANHEETLEFFSIKVEHGPLTSRLQHVQPGDSVLVGKRATGTLTLGNLRKGTRLWLLATGTGLAPFLSIVKDPETYTRFDRVIVAHTCREVADLAYRDYLERQLPRDEHLGELVAPRLRYYPSVTREPFLTRGRITDLLRSGQAFDDLELPLLNHHDDRVMICGNPQMVRETSAWLDAQGFKEGNSGDPGDYLVEKAFAQS
jgi:ferredoxin--NADP+ reductase